MNPNRVVALLSSLPLSIAAMSVCAQTQSAPAGRSAPAAQPAPSRAQPSNAAPPNSATNAPATQNNSPPQQPSNLSSPGVPNASVPAGTQPVDPLAPSNATSPLNPNNPLNANNPANPNSALNPNVPNAKTIEPAGPSNTPSDIASLPTRQSSLTLLDANRDGYISAEEMAGNARARAAVVACDTDRDGKIASYEYSACTSGNQR